MQIRQEQRIKSFPSQLQPVVVFVSCQPPSYKADLVFLQQFDIWLCATWFEILWDSRCWQQAWTLSDMIIKLMVFLLRKCVKCGILKSQSGAWVFREKKIIVQFLSLEGWSSLLKYRARSALLPPEHNWHMCTGAFGWNTWQNANAWCLQSPQCKTHFLTSKTKWDGKLFCWVREAVKSYLADCFR